MRAALAEGTTTSNSAADVPAERFTSTSRIKLPSVEIVAPGKSFTRRRYWPRFLMTTSSLPRTSSTTTPTWRPAARTITIFM